MVTTEYYLPNLDTLMSNRIPIEIGQSSLINPFKNEVLFYYPEKVENTPTNYLRVCIIVRGIACMYTVWLIYIKFKFRRILKDINASIGRDII